MNKLYILVADAGRAKIFRADRPFTAAAPLALIYDQVHYLGSREQETGFAGELCRRLHKECQGEPGDGLVLIAPAPFLEQLHRQLNPASREILLDMLDIDLVQVPAAQLARHLAAVQTKSRGITLSQLSE